MAGGACDAGKRHEQRTKGALITITDVNVGQNEPLPVDGEIQIAFDRYLLPKSVTRQSVGVLDANGEPLDPVITRYDPISRTISVSGPNATWLTPGQPYKLLLVLPPDEETDDRGLRAIDRQTLDPNQTLEFAFFAAEPRGVKNEKTIDFCGDVLPIFTKSCTKGTCHASKSVDPETGNVIKPAMGLVLDSFTGITKTAIGRVASGANTGASASTPEPVGRVFGVNMAIIDPGEPDNSWLLYKIALAREPGVAGSVSAPFVCNKTPDINEIAPRTVDPFRFDVKVNQPEDIERAVLADFVLGREMPYPPNHGLSFDERERIRIWIAQGAKMTDCGGCAPAAFDLDAGASDQ